jgi:hypothetical protein
MAVAVEHEWKKGSAELLILSLLEAQPRHGYEIGRLIDVRSEAHSIFTSPPSIPCCTGSKNEAGFADAGSKERIKDAAATTA